MAIEILDINELYDVALSIYAEQYGVNKDQLGKSFQVDSKVFAGIMQSVFLYIHEVQNSAYPTLASGEDLARIGFTNIERYPEKAEYGIYYADVYGTNGDVIPEGTQYVKSIGDADYVYITDSDFIFTGPAGVIQLRALTSGTKAGLEVGETVNSVQPLNGPTNGAVIKSIITPAKDEEDEEDYRKDVLDSYRLVPQGGAKSDYRLWCNYIPEIRTVYPYLAQGGYGNINIYVEATKSASGPLGLIGIPTQAVLDEVYKNQDGTETGVVIINPDTGQGRKPCGVQNFYVFPIVPIPVDIFFSELSNEDTEPEIRESLDDYTYKIRPFVAGADTLGDKNDLLAIGGLLSNVYELFAGTGNTFTSMTFKVEGTEFSSYKFKLGNIPYIRNIYNNGIAIIS